MLPYRTDERKASSNGQAPEWTDGDVLDLAREARSEHQAGKAWPEYLLGIYPYLEERQRLLVDTELGIILRDLLILSIAEQVSERDREAARRTAELAELAWPEPKPVESVPPVELAVDLLPPLLLDAVASLSMRFQVATPVPLLLALGATAAATVGRGSVYVRPGYEESTSLYVCAVLAPGERKSPLHTVIMAGLYEAESEIRADAQARRDAVEVERRKLEREITGLRYKLRTESKRVKADEAQVADLETKIEAKLLDLDAHPLPEIPKPIVSESTPEALAMRAGKQGGRVIVASSEATALAIANGRYSKAETPADEVWRVGYDGNAPWAAERADSTRGAYVRRLSLSLVTTTQPVSIAALQRNPVLAHGGLLDRIQFVCPPSMLGRRNIPLARESRPGIEEQRLADRLSAIMVDHWYLEEPRSYRFGPEALVLFNSYEESLASNGHSGCYRLGRSAAVGGIRARVAWTGVSGAVKLGS
jgi:hypothetical protein